MSYDGHAGAPPSESRSSSMCSSRRGSARFVSFPHGTPSAASDDYCDEDDSDGVTDTSSHFERRSSLASEGETPCSHPLSWRADALDVGDRLAASSAAKKGGASVDSIIDLVQA